MQRREILDASKIIDTIDKLTLRIEDRFPNAGLYHVCQRLLEHAQETPQTVRWIVQPNYWFRLFSYAGVGLILVALIYTTSQFDFKLGKMTFSDFITLVEAATNELILLGAGIIFIVTYENRLKRRRVITALNRLRSIAHVIDAHQLTKDPDSISQGSHATAHSPKRSLSAYQLGRYLDYCSEMLALTSKVAFLYVQRFDDPVALNAVNDIESLTSGLSRKIWQKIMLIKAEQKTADNGSSG